VSAVQATKILACLACVMVLLYSKLRRRASEYRAPAEWLGRSLDALALKAEVDRVRHNYLAARGPAKGVCFHRSLLASARRAVARSAYFRDRKTEEPGGAHAA
jgi:hypothetical protein